MTSSPKLYEPNTTPFHRLVVLTKKTPAELCSEKELDISYSLFDYYAYRTKEMPSKFIPIFARYIRPTKLVSTIKAAYGF